MDDLYYGVFTARSDGTTPKPSKMMDGTQYDGIDEAVVAATQLSKSLTCTMEVREVFVRVGDVVLTVKPVEA